MKFNALIRFVLPCLFAVAGCGGDSGGGPVTAGDTNPPAAISNLAIAAPKSANLTLTWTATGDDGNVGRATSYDVRYSTSTITSQNWASAGAITGEPAPQAAGQTEIFPIAGFDPSTSYYFAVRAMDDASNVSALSNVASGTSPGALEVISKPRFELVTP